MRWKEPTLILWKRVAGILISRPKTLVYIVDNTGYFSGGMSDPPRARFKIRLVYTDADGNGVFDNGVDPIEGLRLAALEPYKWVK